MIKGSRFLMSVLRSGACESLKVVDNVVAGLDAGHAQREGLGPSVDEVREPPTPRAGSSSRGCRSTAGSGSI